MKTKHAVTLLVVGYCVEFIGALRKITHAADANMLLTIALLLKIVGGLLFLYKILTYPKFKDILDW